MLPTELDKEAEIVALQFGVKGSETYNLARDMFIMGATWHEKQIELKKAYKKIYAKPKEEVLIGKVKMDESKLQRGISAKGGWSKKQIASLGEDMTKQGWRKRLMGKLVTQEQYNQFLSLAKK